MNIVKVVPKDIYVTLELPLKEVDMLLSYMDRCEMRANLVEEPQLVEVSKFVEEEFFPELEKMVEDLKRHGT